MNQSAKQWLFKKFPGAPNFLDRVGLPDEDIELVFDAKDSIFESEKFRYEVIRAYHDFLKGRFISARDALEKLVRDTSNNDVDKLKLLHLNLAWVYFNLAGEFRYKRIKEKSIEFTTNTRHYTEKTLENFEMTLEISKATKDMFYVKALIAHGFFLSWSEKYQEAVDVFAKALKLAETIKPAYLDGVAKCYDGIGQVYFKKGNYDEDIHYLNKALEIYEDVGNAEGVLEIQHNVALDMWKKTHQDLRKTISKLKAHLEYKKKIGDYKVVVTVCESIAGILDDAGKAEEAKKYRYAAEQIRKEFQIM